MRTVDDAGVITSFTGHGLGLEVRDYPLIGPDRGGRVSDGCVDESSDIELESGMVVNLEASIFAPGVASLHVERSFVVGEAGGKGLVVQERDAPFIPSNER
jgi:Xaa-Pro aminopeptidase